MIRIYSSDNVLFHAPLFGKITSPPPLAGQIVYKDVIGLTGDSLRDKVLEAVRFDS